jgi:hypothetical protein
VSGRRGTHAFFAGVPLRKARALHPADAMIRSLAAGMAGTPGQRHAAAPQARAADSEPRIYARRFSRSNGAKKAIEGGNCVP